MRCLRQHSIVLLVPPFHKCYTALPLYLLTRHQSRLPSPPNSFSVATCFNDTRPVDCKHCAAEPETTADQNSVGTLQCTFVTLNCRFPGALPVVTQLSCTGLHVGTSSYLCPDMFVHIDMWLRLCKVSWEHCCTNIYRNLQMDGSWGKFSCVR